MCQDLQEEPRLIGQNVVKSICRISLLKSLQPPWWIFFVGKSDRLRSTICICVFKRLKERFCWSSRFDVFPGSDPCETDLFASIDCNALSSIASNRRKEKEGKDSKRKRTKGKESRLLYRALDLTQTWPRA